MESLRRPCRCLLGCLCGIGGKGAPVYSTAVIGDAVGDPLKDTVGPSLHILIKLENILAITLLPLFIIYSFYGE